MHTFLAHLSIPFRHIFRLLHFHIWKLAIHGIKIYLPWHKTESRIVILKNDGLGDFIISLSAIRQIHRHFHPQGYKITLITSKTTKDIAEKSGYFDEIILCSMTEYIEKTPVERMNFLRKLYPQPPKIAIMMMAGDLRLESNMLICLSGAKRQYAINWSQLPKEHWHEYNDRKTDIANDANIPSHIRAIAKQQLRPYENWIMPARKHLIQCHYTKVFTAQSGENIYDLENRLAQAVCQNDCRVETDNLDYCLDNNSLPDEFQLPHQYYIVVPCGTNTINVRQWPAERYLEIILRIHQDFPQYLPIIVGSTAEIQYSRQLITQLPPAIHAINLCGKTTIEQLIALIDQAVFVFGQDTGTTHISSLRNIPTACIVSGQIPNFYFPSPYYPNTIAITAPDISCADCRGICPYSDTGIAPYPCIDKISVDHVWEKMCKLLHKFCR